MEPGMILRRKIVQGATRITTLWNEPESTQPRGTTLDYHFCEDDEVMDVYTWLLNFKKKKQQHPLDEVFRKVRVGAENLDLGNIPIMRAFETLPPDVYMVRDEAAALEVLETHKRILLGYIADIVNINNYFFASRN